MEKVASLFVKEVISTSKTRAVGLYGDLGAGKTTFVQMIARELGVKEPVKSPTFAILKKYLCENKEIEKLVHIDAYRLSSGQGLNSIGFPQMVGDPKTIVLIEWASNVEDILPKNNIKLYFEYSSEGGRKITEVS